MPTSRDDNDFAKEMNDYVNTSVSSAALDAAIEFISKTLTPSEVFTTKELCEWAENNGYVKE